MHPHAYLHSVTTVTNTLTWCVGTGVWVWLMVASTNLLSRTLRACTCALSLSSTLTHHRTAPHSTGITSHAAMGQHQKARNNMTNQHTNTHEQVYDVFGHSLESGEKRTPRTSVRAASPLPSYAYSLTAYHAIHASQQKEKPQHKCTVPSLSSHTCTYVVTKANALISTTRRLNPSLSWVTTTIITICFNPFSPHNVFEISNTRFLSSCLHHHSNCTIRSAIGSRGVGGLPSGCKVILLTHP
jgi:hypothetical protein